MTAEPAALGRRMRETRGFVESRLKDLRTLFSAEAVTIRAEVAKHVREITLTPKGRAYIASGTWDLLGAWQHGWCRGPESNWLRPPFQGGALPMSYPGFSTTYRRFKVVGAIVASVHFRFFDT